MSEIIVDNEFITLEYRSDINAIYHVMHQHVEGDVFHAALDAGIEAMQQYGTNKWIADDSINSLTTQADQEWSVKSFGPRATAAGWKYWALIVPEELGGRMDMSLIVDTYYNLGVTINVFTNLEDAENWITSL